jgi:hypothetical protein
MTNRYRSIAAALAAALLVAWTATADAAPGGRNLCRSGNASNLRHNADSYVFKLRRRTLSPFGKSKRAGHYACNSRVGRWHALARSNRWLIDRVYANGDFVAYTMAAKPIVPGSGHPWRLRTMNTASGRIALDIDFTYGAFITDFVLGRSGAIAYISYAFQEREGDWHYWVKLRDSRGTHVLDEGPEIADYSLTRSWRTISWVNGGQRKRATLR